jgi:erythromycin esterase-like protein
MIQIFALMIKVLLAFVAGILAAAFVYLLSALISARLAFNLAAAGAALWLVTYGFTNVFFRLSGSRYPSQLAMAVSVLYIASIGALLAAPHLVEGSSPSSYVASDSIILRLGENTIPLESVNPDSGYEDLNALKPALQSKRVVALGEATHGTREFFQMKHRLLEFLVREMGFEHFAMETSPQAARVIQAYITGGTAKPHSVLYWPWATAEVIDMLDWMRDYNADPSNHSTLQFHGIDPTIGERDRVMAENVAHILEQNGLHSKIVLWAHNYHISNAEGKLGYYLKQMFGEQAYLLGFEFNQGAFTSRMATVHEYRVGPATPAYYAYALAKVNQPVLYLDFETMVRDPELQAWLAADQSSHHFQELHAVFRLHPAWHTLYTSWLDLYDGLIFIEESTPAANLK